MMLTVNNCILRLDNALVTETTLIRVRLVCFKYKAFSLDSFKCNKKICFLFYFWNTSTKLDKFHFILLKLNICSLVTLNLRVYQWFMKSWVLFVETENTNSSVCLKLSTVFFCVKFNYFHAKQWRQNMTV